MEQQVDNIAALDAAVASELRPRLLETFLACVHDLIRQPRLTEEDVAKIESLLASLQGRSEFNVARYRDELQRAKHEWRTVVQLAPPFAALGEAFDETDLVKFRDDSGTPPQLVVPETARKSPWRRTTIPSQGDIEVEVTFNAEWKSRQYLGVVLDGHSEAKEKKRDKIWPTMSSFYEPREPVTARHSRICPPSLHSRARTPTL